MHIFFVNDVISQKDIYHANIDCQWLDVTELPTGTYTFKMSINPEYKVVNIGIKIIANIIKLL